ncbi:MAG: SAM-dependent methyltransferase, partial [Polyangiaceae bacterium]|nr:SAM-dependent methyltransferase [Polyangiaceae bacterium]
MDEIIRAHSGEDPFDEALKLLVARLIHEISSASGEPFLTSPGNSVHHVNRLLRQAAERWPGVLNPRATTRLNEVELTRCAAILSATQLLSEDLIGLDAIFEVMVSRAAKGQKGQYFTPRYVIAEVVKMLCPQPGELVADLACGSGGFLRHALLHEPRCSVWGFDQDLRACRIARVMLAASGQEASRIVCVDSLKLAAKRTDKTPTIEEIMRSKIRGFHGFDLILTNPPFAGDVGKEFSEHYQLARGRRVERDIFRSYAPRAKCLGTLGFARKVRMASRT